MVHSKLVTAGMWVERSGEFELQIVWLERAGLGKSSNMGNFNEILNVHGLLELDWNLYKANKS